MYQICAWIFCNWSYTSIPTKGLVFITTSESCSCAVKHPIMTNYVFYRLCNISSSMCQTFTLANSHEYMVTEAQDPLRPPMGVISN
jgi:hypothetical protein